MFWLDDISKHYAAILPELRTLGYLCTITGSANQVCIMRIGRSATVDVFNDGSWTRRDGLHGSTPQELLDLMKAERSKEVELHLSRNDLRALAQDTLNANGIEATAVRSVRPFEDGSMEVEAYVHSGRPQTMRIASGWDAVCRRWRTRLLC